MHRARWYQLGGQLARSLPVGLRGELRATGIGDRHVYVGVVRVDEVFLVASGVVAATQRGSDEDGREDQGGLSRTYP